jgi:hypothetical protein
VPTVPKPTAAERKPFTTTLIEVARLHGKAQLGSYAGGTSSLAERVSGSKPGSVDLRFGADLPVSVEMERSLLRWIEVWRRKVEGQNPALPSQDKTSSARKAQAQAILGERGMDPTAVAFIYGTTTEAVKKQRGRNGLDPDTGQRKGALNQERIDGKPSRQSPLTAPPSSVLAGLEALAAED